jgi:hypothetical protein
VGAVRQVPGEVMVSWQVPGLMERVWPQEPVLVPAWYKQIMKVALAKQ